MHEVGNGTLIVFSSCLSYSNCFHLGLIELRRIEAAEYIANELSRSRNVVYLPSGQNMLLNVSGAAQ